MTDTDEKKKRTGKIKKIYIISPGTHGGIASVINIYREYYAADFNLHFIRSYSGDSRLKDVAFFLRALGKTFYICLSGQEAAFHIHTASKGSFFRKSIIAKLCLFFNKYVIIHIHSGIFNSFIDSSNPRKKERIIGLFKRVQKVVVLTEAWREILAKQFNRKDLVVVYNPVEVDTLPRQLDRLTVNICYAGKFAESKGVYDLIKAAKFIKAEAYQLHMYGNGEIVQVKETIKEEGTEQFITVHGWVDREQMKAIYAQSEIVVLPSYAEGFPMTVLEGMANGLPIIATKVGGIPEAIIDGYNGFLIIPGDIVELARKIEYLINNPGLRKEMGEKGRKVIEEKYSVEKIKEQLRDLYEGINFSG